jgi:isoleucyl-tRNA synthetase
MSSIYMDVLKDRLYCEAADSEARRSAQTAMSDILNTLIRLLAPVLIHTCEEAWDALAYKPEDVDSVHLACMPEALPTLKGTFTPEQWDTLLAVRDAIFRCLEGLKQDKVIARNPETSVTVQCDQETADLLNAYGTDQYAALCIVSEIKVVPGHESIEISAAKSQAQKCERCWNYLATVGTHDSHPDLCDRCHAVVAKST